MTISRVTSQDSTNGGAASTSVSFVFPATPTQGNLMVAIFSWRQTGTTVTAVPSGWTKASPSPADGELAGLHLYWRIAGASEPTNHTWTLSAAVKSAGLGSEYSSTTGWPTTPIGVVTSSSGASGTTGLSTGTTGTSAAVSGAHILVLGAHACNTNATWSGHAGTNVTAAEIAEMSSTGGPTNTRNTTSVSEGIRTTGNSTFAVTATLSASNSWAALVATFYENSSSSSLPVDAAAITLTGQNIGLERSYSLPADATAITVTGQAVDFAYSYTLAVDQAALGLTGADIATSYIAQLAVDPQSLILTPAVVAGQFDTSVYVGSVGLVGQDVALGLSYALAVDAAALAVTGQEIVLQDGNSATLPVTPLTIALTGADLIGQYALGVTPTTTALTGQDVGLNAILAVDAASLTPTGAAIPLASTLATGSAALVLTPAAITLDTNQEAALSVSAAPLGLVGQNVGVGVYISALSSVSGTAASPVNAVGVPNGVYTTNTGNSSWTHRWRMGTISGGPHVSSGTHTVTIRVRKSSGGGSNPSVTAISLFQGVNLISELLGSPVAIASAVMEEIQVTFAGNLLTGLEQVDIRVATAGAGNGGNARSVQLDAIQWLPVYGVQSISLTADPWTMTLTGRDIALIASGDEVLTVERPVLSVSGAVAGEIANATYAGSIGVVGASVAGEITVDNSVGFMRLTGNDIQMRDGGSLSASLFVDPGVLALAGVEVDTEEVVYLDEGRPSVAPANISIYSDQWDDLPVDAAALGLTGAAVAGELAQALFVGSVGFYGADIELRLRDGDGDAVLSCDAAALGLTGQAIDGEEATVVDAGLAGLATRDIGMLPSLVVDYTSLILAGQDVTLPFTNNRQLPVEPATLSLLGRDSFFVEGANAIVQVDPATMTLSGQNMEWLSGNGVAVVPATLRLTPNHLVGYLSKGYGNCVYGVSFYGVEGSGCRDHVLPVQRASVTLQGQDLGMSNTRSLAVDARPMFLFGRSVPLTATDNYSNIVDANSMALTGQEIALSVVDNRVLAVDAAAVSLTGATVLTYEASNPITGVEAPVLALVGQDVRLEWQNNHTLATDSGSISLYGIDVGFNAPSGEFLAVDAASLSLVGQDILQTVTGGFTLGVDAARLSLIGQDIRNNQNWQKVETLTQGWSSLSTGGTTWDEEFGASDGGWLKNGS